MSERWAHSLLSAEEEIPRDARPLWDDLADRLEASPFLRAGWCEAWRRAFGKGTLEVHLLRDAADPSGPVVALLPLERRGGGLFSPTNWHTPEFAILSESDEATRALLQAVLRTRPQRLVLNFIPREQARIVEDLEQSAGFTSLQRVVQKAPYLPIEGSFEEYERVLGSKMLANVRRRRRQLEKKGIVEFEFDRGTNLDPQLDEGFAIEASGWKGEGGTAILSDPKTDQFYREIARWAEGRGWLSLAFLRLDGKAIAFAMNLEQGERDYQIKSGYLQEYRNFGPGKLLHYEMSQRTFEHGFDFYEFLGTDLAWKLEWTDKTRERVRIEAYRKSPLGTLQYFMQRHGRPFAKGLRDRLRTFRPTGSS